MKVHIFPDLAATRLIAGDVNPSKLVVPNRKLMQHGSGHVADS
jgi:hypothetical protein